MRLIKRILLSVYRRVKRIRNRILIKRKNALLSRNCFINENCEFEGNNKVAGDSELYDCYVGKGSYIQTGCLFKKTKVGRFCSIAANVRIVDGNHPTRDFISTYPAFYRKEGFCGLDYGVEKEYQEYAYTDSSEKWFCEIGNDVWIGDSATIMNGCKIGDGAVIGAGAIVTHDVSPYSVVVGIPAKEIRKRFDEIMITKLLDFSWWNKDDEWIKCNIVSFSDAKKMEKLIDDTKNPVNDY